MPKKSIPILTAVFLTMIFSSCTCIYFNTFHNIRKYYNSAEKTRKKDGRDTAKGAEVKQYNDAITKASRVLERHPNSSWVDDALYIIGSSYYYLGEYGKSARKFKELFANYPESEYVPRSRIILAKAKLQLKEEAEAIVIFEEIFEKEKDKKMRADAARSLGEYYFEAKDYEKANRFFLSLIDSLGDETGKLRALTYVADGYFDGYSFDKASEKYKEALKHDPDTSQYYRIMFRLAECDYFLNDVSGGLKRLSELADNETYYDSLAPIRLKIAEGYEWEGNIEAAIESYEKVIIENPQRQPAAIAYYELGLIYQYDFEDLKKAREHYQKARDEIRNSTITQDATRRASKLAQLEQYSKSGLAAASGDSTVVLDKEELDQLSKNQFMLGELFYFDLEKPDSAVHTFEILVERFPESRYAPRAMMSISHIYRVDFADTLTADSIMRMVLKQFPRYDESEIVVNRLGLSGTIADTGYAAKVIATAEQFLEEFIELDSSKYYMQIMIDSIKAADTLEVDDSLQVTDSIIAADSSVTIDSLTEIDSMRIPEAEVPQGIVQASDTAGDDEPVRLTDFLQHPDTGKIHDSGAILPSETVDDSLRMSDTSSTRAMAPDADSAKSEDSTMISQTVKAADTSQDTDAAKPPDTIPPIDSVPTADSAVFADTGGIADTGMVDATPRIEAPEMSADSGQEIETPAVADSQLGIDSAMVTDMVSRDDSAWAADSTTPPDSSEDITKISPEDMSLTDYIRMVDSARHADSALAARKKTPDDTIPAAEYNPPADTTAFSDSLGVSDLLLSADSLVTVDSSLTAALPPVGDSTQAIDSSEIVDTIPAIDYWNEAYLAAVKNYSEKQIDLLDSARFYYQYVIDTFPFSDYSIQARFVLLWVYDNYLDPGDSSLRVLYQNFVDSFPENEYAEAIGTQYNIQPSQSSRRTSSPRQETRQEEEETAFADADDGLQIEPDTSLEPSSAISHFITDEDGNQLPPANEYYLREDLAFVYPWEAAAYRIEDKLYFQIRIDFSGEVVEVILMNPTESEELNERIIETVKMTRFDAGRIPADLYDHWFYYDRTVTIPNELRQ